MKLKDKVPTLYEGKIDSALLDKEVPEEKYTNCSNCHLCINDNQPRAKTKCCDYHPNLPNYIVGAILTQEEESQSEGYLRIKRKIVEKKGVTPYGIMAPLNHFIKFKKSRLDPYAWPKKMAIQELLCPYYDHGSCTIWKFRSNLCATYHCNSVAGKSGLRYWDILYKYLQLVEYSLSIYILKALGYSSQKIINKPLTPIDLKLEDNSGALNISLYDDIWDNWKGDELSFYKQCFRIFQDITPMMFQEIIGNSGVKLEQDLIYQKEEFFSKIIPGKLLFDEEALDIEVQPNKIVKINGREIPIILYHFIRAFDGMMETDIIIRKSMLVQNSIVNQINPLIEQGILTIKE